jgi:uncharacterized membrane protein YqjE
VSAVNSDGSESRNSSTAELVKQLSGQLSLLIRKELDLAKAELTEKGKAAGVGAGMFGGAGVVALLALGALTAAVILLLDKGMEAWLAALIVAALYGAIAAVLALVGRDRVREGMPPAEQTIETVKEDVQWAKSQAKSARR